MRRVLWIAPVWIALGALTLAPPAHAVTVEGVRFAERIETPSAVLELHGAGLLRYRLVIKAYVAAFYLQPGSGSGEALGDVPRRLEIEYFWNIGAADFGRSTHVGIERNVGGEAYERLRPRIERMNALYRDIAPGDRYALTYIPGMGTELSLNGEPLGVVEGADFARAIFAIWLGPDPLDRKLKAKLLPGT